VGPTVNSVVRRCVVTRKGLRRPSKALSHGCLNLFPSLPQRRNRDLFISHGKCTFKSRRRRSPQWLKLNYLFLRRTQTLPPFLQTLCAEISSSAAFSAVASLKFTCGLKLCLEELPLESSLIGQSIYFIL